MKLKEEGTKVMFALIRLGKSCMRCGWHQLKQRDEREEDDDEEEDLRSQVGGRWVQVPSSHCLGWRERLRGDLFCNAEIFRKFRTRTDRKGFTGQERPRYAVLQTF